MMGMGTEVRRRCATGSQQLLISLNYAPFNDLLLPRVKAPIVLGQLRRLGLLNGPAKIASCTEYSTEYSLSICLPCRKFSPYLLL